MAKKALTPAEKEEEHRKQEAAWWQKVITYYLNQMYHAEVDREIERSRTEQTPLLSYMAQVVHERRIVEQLYEKKAGQLSAYEVLEKMDKYQEADSPFRALLTDLKESKEKPEDPAAQEKAERSLSRCVEEAPVQIVNRTRRNAMRVKRAAQPRRGQQPEPQEPPKPDPVEEERTRYEMTFLRAVMPPELYRKLCEELTKQGRAVDPEKDFLFIPEREGGRSYEEYTAAHKVDPVEKDGQLANLDEIVTSAAYMLAAYEQKDEPDFDEKAADARAMELSGSKGFRAYVGSHPGSLLAAARNTGIEATHRELMALDKSIRKRDAVLGSVRDAMRRTASGKTAAYHQVMNAIDRFASSPDDPPEEERSALGLKLAQYVMTEGNPASPHYKKEDAMLAARAMKALLPKRDFEAFLTTANQGRSEGQKLRAEELEGPVPRRPEAAERQGPVLERNEQWN